MLKRPDFDFLKIFVTAVRMATICIVLSLSAIENLDLCSLDISNAFTNRDLEKEVYIEQPNDWPFTLAILARCFVF